MVAFGLWLTTFALAMLAGCGMLNVGQDADSPQRQLTGILMGPIGLELPPDAEAVVELHGTLANDQATQVAAARLDAAMGLPLEFTLQYDPALVVPGGVYTLSTHIERLGRPLFTAEVGRLRLLPTPPSRVELHLRPVGQAGENFLEPFPEELVCEGSSPVWALRIRGDSAAFSLLSESGVTDGPEPLAGRWIRDEVSTFSMTWRGNFDQKNWLMADIENRSCLDPLLDDPQINPHEYSARVELSSGRILYGCCRKASTPPQDAASAPSIPLTALGHRSDGWPQYLADLLPAMNVCLERAGTEPGMRVTKAWPMNHGMVGVRGRTGSGHRWDCITPQLGKAIDRFEFLPRTAADVPGEGNILFTPAGQPPPQGACWSHERVVDKDSFVGWLSEQVC